jgi:undecaprenyl phosphate N,N'-diacetylbacillosamine 1-phosphate transferase
MKFKLDIWYIDNVSFATDCKVMFLTLKKVIKKEGINQEQQATVEVFKGNN